MLAPGLAQLGRVWDWGGAGSCLPDVPSSIPLEHSLGGTAMPVELDIGVLRWLGLFQDSRVQFYIATTTTSSTAAPVLKWCWWGKFHLQCDTETWQLVYVVRKQFCNIKLTHMPGSSEARKDVEPIVRKYPPWKLWCRSKTQRIFLWRASSPSCHLRLFSGKVRSNAKGSALCIPSEPLNADFLINNRKLLPT